MTENCSIERDIRLFTDVNAAWIRFVEISAQRQLHGGMYIHSPHAREVQPLGPNNERPKLLCSTQTAHAVILAEEIPKGKTHIYFREPMAERMRIWAYRLAPKRVRERAVRWLSPNFTVGVMVLVVSGGRRVLLTQSTYRSGWFLPGGLLKRGEGPVEAAQREGREELGVDLEVRPPHRASISPHRQFVTFFCVASLDETTFKIESPSSSDAEIRERRWFDINELPALARELGALTAEDYRAMGSAASE
jgi:8-oxo-dGTP diphosphatase